MSGLAAARRLREKGYDVLVLEARDRIGGRVLTVRDDRATRPIELGAEFLHGDTPAIDEIADELGLRSVEVTGDRFEVRDGRLRPVRDFWKRVHGVLGRIDPEREPERTVAEFLRSTPGGRRLARDRALAREFVQGFQAADVSRISERAVAAAGDPGAEEDSKRMRRLLDGYDAIPAALAIPIADRVLLQHEVTEIEWEPGAVSVRARVGSPSRQHTFAATAAIVTVPVGVLQTEPGRKGTIVITPALSDRTEPLSRITMGGVVRVVLQFSEPFWERSRDERRHCTCFLHLHDDRIPVWWTSYPERTPMLTGWSGGPPAERLMAQGEDAVIDAAIGALATSFHTRRSRIAQMLVGHWTHDWINDPHARGAYAYALVGGTESPDALKRPVRRTLFFAGEALASDDGAGTVHGAIESGRTAAQQVMRAVS